jgi:hypothetical protein
MLNLKFSEASPLPPQQEIGSLAALWRKAATKDFDSHLTV